MFSPDSPQYVDFPEDDRADARTMPTFVSTTTLQKDVIILVDATNFDDDWFDQAKEVRWEGSANILFWLNVLFFFF